MQPLSKHYSLRAALLFPIHKPPKEDVWVNVRDGQITSIGPAEEKVRYDPGDCAVLPGLVNAHAHLEFSDLETPLGKRHMPVAEWIGEVLAWRTSRERTTTHQRVGKGIAQSVAAGVVAIADIVSEDESFTNTPLHYRAFQELIATNDEQVAIAIEKIRSFDAEKKWILAIWAQPARTLLGREAHLGEGSRPGKRIKCSAGSPFSGNARRTDFSCDRRGSF